MYTAHRAALKTAVLAAPLMAALGLAGISPAQAQFGSNLIINGNAEAGSGSATGDDIEAVPGFTTTGSFTVVQYGAASPPRPIPAPPTEAATSLRGGRTTLRRAPPSSST